MMPGPDRAIRFTLTCDGTSDAVLRHHVEWLLKENSQPHIVFDGAFADLRTVFRPARFLHDRIRLAVELYPCDILFVHRDAEATSPLQRRREIERAIAEATVPCPFVCLIPVRMTEAWLLFDEHAIRKAAGNPHGSAKLTLPRLKDLEDLPDPKATLFEILKTASELTGRRAKAFRPESARSRIADYIQDFAKLRSLRAFQTLESEIAKVLREIDAIRG